MEPARTKGKKWVLLAAGSKDWVNYRHQADVCHVYQLMRRNGIPDEQIVVMMYDDIAYHIKNRKPGQIINRPNGPDVYVGVPKDYTGDDVSAANFLSVLSGNSAAVSRTSGTKKVLQSGENDTVFVYLTDHGGCGVFDFPDTTLYAYNLIQTVEEMSAQRKFGKMVFYLEACQSGSMLMSLKEKNVYGVSACSPGESSYSYVSDTNLKTPLCSLFTKYWLDHTEKADLEKTTFGDQFSYIHENVLNFLKEWNLLHRLPHQKKPLVQTPCNYGDMSILQSPLSEFLGQMRVLGGEVGPSGVLDLELSDLVETTEIPLRILENSIKDEKDEKQKKILQKQYDDFKRKRSSVDEAMQKMVKYLGAPEALSDKREMTRMYELKVVAEHFRTKLFNWEKQPLIVTPTHLQVLVNLCERGLKTETINDIISRVSKEVTF